MKKVGILLGTLILFFCIIFSINFISAKNLYVATNGNDSVTYVDNDINHQWLTPYRAWNQAQAGDIVYFRAGTYVMTYMLDSGLTPTTTAPWNGGNEGTVDYPITFTKYPEDVGDVIFQANFARLAYSCMLFIGRDYITVSNITFDGHTTSSTMGAPRAISIASGNYEGSTDSATGVTLDHLYIHDWNYGDNAWGIDIGSGAEAPSRSNIHVTNCRLRGNLGGQWSNEMGYVGIGVFNTANVHIENNEISETVVGIILKHPYSGYSDTGSTIKGNWIHNQTLGGGSMHMASIFLDDNYVTVENNICEHGIGTGDDVGHVHKPNETLGSHNIINHNTLAFYGIELTNSINCHETIFTNNIFKSYINAGTNHTWNYNLYISGTKIGVNDTSGIPIFVGGTNPSTILGYALASNSPGYRNASDGTDRGANVSKVGIDAGSGEIPTCTESWTCSSWSTCISNSQSRTCTDSNNCGTIDNRPALTQSCTNPIQGNLYNECTNYSTNHPEWIFCDDFESSSPLVGTGRYFQYDNNNGEFIIINNTGVNNSRAIRALFQQGEVGAGSLNLGFGRNPNSYMNRGIRTNEDFREVYYRMYLKLDSNWQGDSGKLSRATVFSSSTDWSQAMIAHLWGDGNYHLLIDPASCISGGVVQCVGYNDFSHLQWIGAASGKTAIFNGSYNNQWLCIENHVKLNDPGQSNGIEEFWINNNLEASRTNLNFVGTYTDYSINAVFFENWWNSGSIKQQERYFDNIVVSSQRIGCGNYTIQPPTTNVTTMQKLLSGFGSFKSGGSLSDYISKIKEFILG